MKKAILTIMFLAFFVSLVLAQQDLSGYENQSKEIRKVVGKIPIDPNTGEIDKNRLLGISSKAEERIKKINSWLEENASWLKVIFGMVPEISWLFVWGLYFWLLFFVMFVLNSERTFLYLIKKKMAFIIGAAVFVMLIVIKVNVIMGSVIVNLVGFVFNFLIPMGIVVGIIGVIIFGILLAFFGGEVAYVIFRVALMIKKRREQKEKEEEEENREVLKAIVSEATKST